MGQLRGFALALVVLAMLGAGLGYLVWPGPETTPPDFDQTGPRLVALSALAFVFMASLIFGRPKASEILRGTLFWGGLCILLVVGYTFRHDIVNGGYRVLGALSPGLAVTQDDGSILVVRDRSGHFQVGSTVNGHPVDMLFDTGASTVVLTYQDAVEAGFHPESLQFTVPVRTANGQAMVAPVRIDRLTIADLQLSDLRAFVARDGALETSLLGMRALDRLKSWRIEGDRLILIPSPLSR
ncbi:retropepsin-like aspartic protease family protein [Roseibium aestuarii]|uniref:TIGR02281 family clan AA aspartic protease n=1 Tax=Roseibium aestuarii TaxID=2600299 RepID=A0ABW4JUD4_9HYPH|nr:TIGR02281 family clan AA aspartic protease [Roseibium aestuarii]